MAVASGLSAAGNYFAQPLLGLLRSELGMATSTATLTVAISQIGYALGLCLLVPLGDWYSRRTLSAGLLTATAVLLAIGGGSPNGGVLLAATGLVAVTSVGAQVLVPFAAELSTDDNRARNIGIVMAGVIAGGILGRAFAGVVADAAGWRSVYWITAVLLLVLAATILRVLPDSASHREEGATFGKLMKSTASLLVELPGLRRPILIAALSMASYITHLSTITLLLDEKPYGYSSAIIGLIGLVGAVGPLWMPRAGKFVDRGYGKAVLAGGLLFSVLAWAVMIPAQHGQIAWLIAGMILINMGQMSALNATQNACYDLRPEARSRINAVFMTLFFAGGAIGGTLVPVAWSAGKWTGVCVMGLVLAGCGLLIAVSTRRRTATHAA
ncbi:MFS transporter [Streptomyces sp. NPDC058534]|uniref:MFS transporter n=1 Tax=Streptomyces sp. NPDC058534 TaxID=3346541 RepID=UPI003659DA61